MDIAEIITIIYLIIRMLINIACYVFLIWLCISFIDIIAHNLTSGYEYPNWNLLTYFIK